MKRTPIAAASLSFLAVVVLTLGTVASHADIVLVKWIGLEGGSRVQISDGTTPTGNAFSFVLEADPAPDPRVFPDIGTNYQGGIYSAETSGTRYSRFRIELRHAGGLEPQSGIIYQGGWLNSRDGGTFQNVGGGTRNWGTGSVVNNAWTPVASFIEDDGVGKEEINWLVMLGEGTGLGDAMANAWGVVWTDTNNDDLINAGDTIAIKYVVGATGIDQADAFAQIDTVAELDAAVGNVDLTNQTKGTMIQIK